jgi:hypothetical protein
VRDEACTSAGMDWSQREVGLVVADYFQPLRLDLLGQADGTAEHGNRLRPVNRVLNSTASRCTMVVRQEVRRMANGGDLTQDGV